MMGTMGTMGTHGARQELRDGRGRGSMRSIRELYQRLLRYITTIPGLIFVFFACLYLFTFRGRLLSYDGASMFATTRAMVTRGSLAIGNWGPATRGRDGLLYSKYGIGQSLVELPGFVIGKIAEVILPPNALPFSEMLALAINPLLMALACVLFYWIARVMGFPRRTSVVAALVLGLATSFWPYSKSDFAEPLLTVGLAGAVLGALLVQKALATEQVERVERWALLAGAGLGVCVLAKYAALVYVPVVCIYLTVVAWRRQSVRQWIRTQAALLLPVAIAAAVVLLVNFLRFDSPFTTGYAPGDHPFTTAIWNGTYGLLFGPYRGLLFFDPLLFVGLVCLPLFMRRRPREALLPLGFLLVSLIIYGTYAPWDGGSCWGPRYLVPILPYLLWPIMELGWLGPRNSQTTTKTNRLTVVRWGAVGLLLVASFAIQVLGVTYNYAVNDIYWQHVVHRIPNYQGMVAASPLLMAIWLAPMMLEYAFTNVVPLAGFASANYPFGPPVPPNIAAVHQLNPNDILYFWFTLLPHPLVWAIAGAVVCGGGMVLAGWHLVRRLRDVSVQERVLATEPVPAVAGRRL